jgi:hypothetical protein
MSILKFIKSLFAQRNEHVESVKQIDKEIAEALYKIEPKETAVVVEEKPKKAKPKKKKPAKKKTNESK